MIQILGESPFLLLVDMGEDRVDMTNHQSGAERNCHAAAAEGIKFIVSGHGGW